MVDCRVSLARRNVCALDTKSRALSYAVVLEVCRKYLGLAASCITGFGPQYVNCNKILRQHPGCLWISTNFVFIVRDMPGNVLSGENWLKRVANGNNSLRATLQDSVCKAWTEIIYSSTSCSECQWRSTNLHGHCLLALMLRKVYELYYRIRALRCRLKIIIAATSLAECLRRTWNLLIHSVLEDELAEKNLSLSLQRTIFSVMLPIRVSVCDKELSPWICWLWRTEQRSAWKTHYDLDYRCLVTDNGSAWFFKNNSIWN